MTDSSVTQEDIRSAIRELQLSGMPLCVHSSLRSFGWVDGGADAVIDAVLAEGCTLMVPTMSWTYEVAPPKHLRPQRNAFDYDAWDRDHGGESVPGESLIYTPASNEIDRDLMGAIPTRVLARPERRRGNDPKGSFTAIGPLARQLVRGQTATSPYDQFEELERLNGYVVLMGVGLNRMTLLHLAESRAGRNLFIRWANDSNGVPSPVLRGNCSEGFPRLVPALRHLIRESHVGSSLWKVLPARETLAVAAAAIRAQPDITHCPNPDCLGCNDAVLGGPILDGF